MKKNLIKFVEISLTIALLVFVYMKAQEFAHLVEWQKVPGAFLEILTASMFFFLGYSVLSYHWLLVAREIQPSTPRKQQLAFFASQPYKYLPTSLFTLSFRAKYAKKLGMNVRESSLAQLIENANMVGSSLLYGALIWIYTIDIWLGLLLTATIVIIGVILWRHHHINIRLKGEHLTLHMRCWLKAISYCFFAWTLVGIGFFIIAFGIDGTPRLLSAISASSTAIGSGMLAIFAPGGIGVREVIFYYFGFSASVIIIWRCITFVIDIIIGIVAIAMIRRYR